MKRTITSCLCSILLMHLTAGWTQIAGSHESTPAANAVPSIQMSNVGLKDAISSLARQTGQNFIMDPRVGSPGVGPDGKPTQPPLVTVRWENLSVEEALGRLLKEHGLVMVTNPATSIARIVFTNQYILPRPAGAAPGSTNLLPLITMDGVPLDMAIQNLAAQEPLHLTIDEPTSRVLSRQIVSFRWTNVTARQALAALLDNYNLLLVEDSASASGRIVAKHADKPAQPK